MEPTVLAGAIEFSPAEIALIIAIVAAGFIVVTAPGWVVVAYAMGRLPAPGATGGKRWAARIGGAFAGLAVTAGVTSVLGGGLGAEPVIAVPLAWVPCWALAALLWRRAPASGPAYAPVPAPVPPGPVPPPVPPATGQGWGR